MSTEKKFEGINFEDLLKKLEEIVKRLEEGDLPLEESLRIYEEGVRISKVCLKKLDEAERKIEVLEQNEEGKLVRRPFQEENDEEEL